MKFTKQKIRESVGVYGKPVLVVSDEFSTLTANMHNDTYVEKHDYYNRSRFCLYFEQFVTHRSQETAAVLENVTETIHNSLYREIITDLSRIRHQCFYGSRDEIAQMLTKLINRLEE